MYTNGFFSFILTYIFSSFVDACSLPARGYADIESRAHGYMHAAARMRCRGWIGGQLCRGYVSDPLVASATMFHSGREDS